MAVVRSPGDRGVLQALVVRTIAMRSSGTSRVISSSPSRSTIVTREHAMAPRLVSAAAPRSRVVVAAAARGPAGPRGDSGPVADHGFVSYRPLDSQPVDLAAHEPVQLRFDFTVRDHILASSPFRGHAFWNGERLMARRAWDAAVLRVDLVSRSVVAGGSIKLQIDIGGSLGIIQTVARSLREGAGVLEPLSETFVVYMSDTFVADGGRIMMTTSVPASVLITALNVFPISASP